MTKPAAVDCNVITLPPAPPTLAPRARTRKRCAADDLLDTAIAGALTAGYLDAQGMIELPAPRGHKGPRLLPVRITIGVPLPDDTEG